MAELHIYRGIQGSGKSTLAQANAVVDGGRVVGRDHLRRLMGFSGIGTLQQEHEVTAIQSRLIVQGLRTDQNVHVDDMNLKSQYVRRLIGIAETCESPYVVHDLTNVPLDVCIERDKNRSTHIGQDLIRGNFERFVKGRVYPLPVPTGSVNTRHLPPEPYVPDTSKPDAILVDLDGTTALKGDRHIHDYDERVFYDLPNKPVISAVRSAVADGVTPIYMTGRKGFEACRVATYAWISEHIGVDAHWLYMRDKHDNRPDYLVKRELFDQKVRAHWNVLYALDDRQQVVDMYREMGITVFQVAPGNF